MSIMGIDVGTTGCKAAVFNTRGKCLAHAYREYHILHKQDGWAELDSRAVLGAVRQVVRKAVSALNTKDPVTALSISSLGEAVTPVTRGGKILSTSILCSDIRGGDLLTKALKGLDQAGFYRINPNILSASYSLPKMLWIKKHQPEIYAKADYFLLWADLVAFALGCDPVSSYCLANRTLLFDIRRQDWSEKLLKLGGIDRAKLPACKPSGTVIGTVSAAAAKEFGLKPGVKVVLGGHDQCCNAVGAGAIEAGSAVCGIGSFECITPVYDHIPNQDYMLKCGLNVEHHIVDNRYVSFIFNQAGLLVKWFRDTFAVADRKLIADPEKIYDHLTAEMPAAPTKLMVLPYFDVTGPPGYITDASGVIAGLKTSTKRGEILKALMEGETYYFIESLEALKKVGIKVNKMTATGGGAKSARWLQIKADILGVPVMRPVTTEATLLGAAILAGSATEVFKSPAEGIGLMVRRDREFAPNRQRHRIYKERYELYRKFFPLLHPSLAALSRQKG